MAVREYVGARYVPIFADAPWTNTVAYEPLTVVLYQGNSYTSRQYVPVGIDILNETFWAETGNYDAQVEAYRKEVIAVQEKLGEKMDILTDAVWIGDSYVQANSLGADIKRRFSTVVSLKLQLIEHNYAVGGTGYSTGSKTFTQQAEDAINDSTYDHSKVKYVFVCGGRNDAAANPDWTSTQMGQAVQQCIVPLVNEFKNAKVIIVPMMFDALTLPTNYYRWYQGILNNANAQVWGVIRYAYTWLTDLFGEILPDGVHPTVRGHALISHYIYNFLTGSMAEREDSYYTIPRNSAIVANGGYFTVNNVGVENNCMSWFNAANAAPKGTVLFSSEIQTLNSPIPISTYSNIILMYNTETFELYPCTLQMTKKDASLAYAVTALKDMPVGKYEGRLQFPVGLRFNVSG